VRILVVTYYFPPSGGPGVQRALKTVRYLRAFGYEPVVLTVEAGAYPSLDESLARDVPEGVRVVRTAAPDPFALYARLTGRSRQQAVAVGTVGQGGGPLARLAVWLRANVFLPDARVGWVPFARRAARDLLREAAREHRPYAAVLTTGPPHSAHLVGLGLGVPWVADFRDPWTAINFYDDLPMTRPARALDRALERRVLRAADAVVTVSPSWARRLDRAGDLSPGTVHVVQNGVDEADLEGVPAAAVRDDAFVLAHVGSLYGTRDPRALWAALRRLRGEGAVPRLVVRLVGRTDPDVRAAAEATGVPVEAVPYVTHTEAVAEMGRAGLLVLSIEPFRADRGMITGKLYEYLASGRPVLALGPPDGDAAALLAETGGGAVLARDDADGVAEAVRQHYAAWEAGAPRAGAAWGAVAPYTRRAQTRRLADVVDRLGGAAPVGR
jgi:glycosyltransferase involved in cell wall biosynthesis